MKTPLQPSWGCTVVGRGGRTLQGAHSFTRGRLGWGWVSVQSSRVPREVGATRDLSSRGGAAGRGGPAGVQTSPLRPLLSCLRHAVRNQM